MKLSHYDHIIVGQGLAGSILALRLVKAGQKILVIDEPSLSQSSKIAAGLYNPIVFKRLIASWNADLFIPTLNDFYADAEKLLNASFHHHTRIVKLFVNEDEKKLWEKQAAKEELTQYLDQQIYSDQTFCNIPTPFGYSFVKQAGFLNAALFLEATKKYLLDHTIYMHEKFAYDALVVSPDHISYKNITAKNIIFCEGYRTTENPLFKDLPFKLTKGEVLDIACEQLNTSDTINKGAFMVPLGNSRYKIGATYQWENLNEEITDAGKKELTTKIEKTLPLPYTIVNHKAGIRPTVIDRRPIIGRHPTHKSVFIFNGMGTKAVMMAPYLAQQFTEHLLHHKPIMEDSDVKRFYNYFKANPE